MPLQAQRTHKRSTVLLIGDRPETVRNSCMPAADANRAAALWQRLLRTPKSGSFAASFASAPLPNNTATKRCFIAQYSTCPGLWLIKMRCVKHFPREQVAK
jgi:hypothetical protein